MKKTTETVMKHIKAEKQKWIILEIIKYITQINKKTL
jgi:hypothetical protein